MKTIFPSKENFKNLAILIAFQTLELQEKLREKKERERTKSNTV